MRFVLAALILLLVVSCNRSAPPQAKTVKSPFPKAIAHGTAAPVQQFAFKLLKTQKDDFFLSPVGVFTALFMTASGAKEETYKEFDNLLFPDYKLSLERKVEGFSQLVTDLENDNQLNFYSSIWVQQHFEINPQYTDLLRSHFHVEAHNIDFSLDESRRTINNDVARHTHNKITELLPPGSTNSLTRLVIINTLHFLANWENAFDKKLTRKATFHSYDQKINVPFMQKEMTIPMTVKNGITYLEIPYQQGRYTMQIFMGKQGEEKAFQQQFDLKLYYELMKQSHKEKVTVILPSWEERFKLNLKPILKSLGLKRAFNEKDAQFYKMSLYKKLFITDVLHQSYIKVGEEGTEAAAATGIVVGIKSISFPKRIMINRPFIYTIYDQKTNMILFMGTQSFSPGSGKNE